MVRSSFSGTEILAIVGKVTKPVIAALSAFLLEQKRNKAQQTIKIRTGRDSFVELKGFGSEDLASMEKSLVKLIEAQKK